MALTLNATSLGTVLGGRIGLGTLTNGGGTDVTTPPPRPTGTLGGIAVPPPPPAVTSAPLAPVTVTAPPPAVTPVFTVPPRPILTPPILQPPIIFVPPSVPAQNKTATQLATGAVSQLNGAATASVTQALNAIRSKSLDGQGLIPYLERKVRIGEVLNELAANWTAPTRSDFADAFSMDANNLNNEVVDSIVSIAILNDKDLSNEILAENTPQPLPADLTDNRKIVWQSVPPGTPLNPPYVILVAVEYQDVATAEDTVNSIMSQLGTTSSGFKLPQAVIQKGVN